MRSRLLQLAGQPYIAWLVLIAGFAVAFGAFSLTALGVADGVRARFEADAVAGRRAIEARIGAYADAVRGVQGLFAASNGLGRAEFRRYAASLDLPQRYPGIYAMSYAARVSHAQREAYESAMRTDTSVNARGYPDFAIRPPGRRAEYFVLQYVEPLDGIEAALGLDLAADPARGTALRRAGDRGVLTASAAFPLATDAQRRLAFSLRAPIYRAGAPLASVVQRREALIGVVGVTIAPWRLMHSLFEQQWLDRVHLRVRDAGYRDAAEPGDELLFDSDWLAAGAHGGWLGGIERAVLRTTHTIDVGGRTWTLDFVARPGYVGAGDCALPLIVLGGGVVTSLLLFVLIRQLSSARADAIELAHRMTQDLRDSQAMLAQAQRMTQALIEALPNPVYFKNTAGCYLGVNKAWERFWGIPRQEMIGKTIYDLYPDDHAAADALDRTDQALWNNPGTQVLEKPVTTRDGIAHETIFYKATFTDQDGALAGLIGTIIDITERKAAERALRVSEERFQLAVRGLSVGLWDWNIACNQIYYSPRFKALLGYDDAEFERLFQAADWPRLHPDDRAGVLAAMAAHLERRVPFRLEYRLRHGSGEYRWFDAHGQAEWDAAGTPLRMAGSIADITDRKLAEEQLLFVATHDTLTQLANRNMFNQRLAHALAKAERQGKSAAVLFIDLDRFKVINDTLGHKIGDSVLQQVARRLVACLRECDTVARLGGDEFVVLVEDIDDPGDVAGVARKLLETITRPLVIEGHEYHLTASIGISTSPDDGQDMQSLMKNADIAMYRAKEHGKNNFQFYSAQMNQHSFERLALENHLRHALERRQLRLHYQPKIEIASNRVIGMEALLRWEHPELGMISPADFVPLAEETGLIVPIGTWVLETACRQTRAWQLDGHSGLRVAVNLSARQFAHDDLVENIARVLDEAGLEARLLELEITESMVMRNPERAVTLLEQLKAMGVMLSIDDFGTGYSSLSYLKRFPIDSLKVDRSFVMDLPDDADDAAITRAVIAMAHSLRLQVIAEGVETHEQLAFLRQHCCDQAQGYHFSKPLDPRAFATYLRGRAEADAALRGTKGRALLW